MNRPPKIAVITGAAKGIGRAIAESFSEQGFHVLIHYNNSYNEALTLCETLTSKGYLARIYKADVTNRSEVDAMMAYCLSEYGGLDVLINNAGISQAKLFVDLEDSDWDSMMNVNLKGIFNCSQSAVRHFLSEKSGKIINISSVWGMVGASCEVHYSTAKAGVIGFTKALAKELGPSGIQVNCIAPGVIKTDMLNAYTCEEVDLLIDATPLLKIGDTRDIAACALYLASSGADFMTGQVLSPNGGFVV